MGVSVSVPADAAGRTLWEAALAWCDATLMSNLLAAFDTMRRLAAPTEITGNALSPKFADQDSGGFLLLISVLSRRAAWDVATKARAKEAMAVEADFRRRVSNGELLVWGVREQPKLERHLTHISRVWAHGLKIDWEANSVRFGKHTFVAMSCVKAAPGSRAATNGVAEDSAGINGRPKFPMGRFVDIARSRTRLPSNKREAEALLEAYKSRHLDKPPAYSTILRKVSGIYRKASSTAV